MTYQDEKDLPEGQKLSTCSRCNEACYVSREAQLEHWPLHKKLCCPVEKDHPVLREGTNHELALAGPVSLDTIDGCAEVIKLLLQNPEERITKRNPRLLTFALRRLKELLSEDPRNFVPSHDNIIESILYDLIRPGKSQFSSDKLDHIFAIPGFANYFLSDELFLTKAMAIRKENGLCPLPCTELDEEGESMTRNEYSSFNDYEDVEGAERKYPGTYTAPLYCSAVCYLVWRMTSAMRRNGLERPALYSAVLGRIFRTWVCPYGRICFPDIQNTAAKSRDWKNRSSHILWFLLSSLSRKSLKCYASRGYETLVPGVTTVELFRRILDDNVAFDDVGVFDDVGAQKHQNLPTILSLMYYADRDKVFPLQERLATDERIFLLNRIATEDGVGFLSSAKVAGCNASSKELLARLVTGCCSSQVLIRMYHRLNELLSKDGKCVDAKTKMLIHKLWDRLQEASVPALAAYVDVVETQR